MSLLLLAELSNGGVLKILKTDISVCGVVWVLPISRLGDLGFLQQSASMLVDFQGCAMYSDSSCVGRASFVPLPPVPPFFRFGGKTVGSDPPPPPPVVSIGIADQLFVCYW